MSTDDLLGHPTCPSWREPQRSIPIRLMKLTRTEAKEESIRDITKRAEPLNPLADLGNRGKPATKSS